MKKIYFLFSIFLFGLTSGLVANPSLITSKDNLSAPNINIDDSKYLSLAYQNGKFFSWNQSNSNTVGIFTSDDNKSYLLSNTGVFTNITYQVLNLTPVTDRLAIAQLSYYRDSTGGVLNNKNFLVAIDSNNNFNVVNDKPIASVNNNFTILNDTTLLAYGVGLDLVTIASDNTVTVTNKVAAYEGGYAPTYFYRTDSDQGIFIGGDQKYHYLTNISATTLTITDLNTTALGNYANNVGVIDNTHIVLRDENGQVYYYDLSNAAHPTSKNLNVYSLVKNFYFKLSNNLSNNYFILNTSNKNYSNNYGIPYLFDATPLVLTSAPIPNQTSLIDMTFSTTTNQGIFIDGSSFASSFEFNNNGQFNFTNKIGNINQYQVINQTLGFATYQGTNILLSSVDNKNWLVAKSVSLLAVSDDTKVNFLNNNVVTNGDVPFKYHNYHNTYFANNAVVLKVANSNLKDVEIESSQGIINLTPHANEINYTFTDFVKYQVTIKFLNPTVTLHYQVILDSFTEKNLLNVFGTDIVNYVAINNNQLYDMQAIDENKSFTVSAFNYNLLQSVQLIRYDNDNLVIRNIINLKENDTISATIVDKHVLKQYACALRVEDWLNQTRMIYLGFMDSNDTLPMTKFWDTQQGKDLRQEVLARGVYSSKQLDGMNAVAINSLIELATTWNYIKVQATTLAYIIVGVITISGTSAVISIGYNFYFEKLINNKKRLKRKQKKHANH